MDLSHTMGWKHRTEKVDRMLGRCLHKYIALSASYFTQPKIVAGKGHCR